MGPNPGVTLDHSGRNSVAVSVSGVVVGLCVVPSLQHGLVLVYAPGHGAGSSPPANFVSRVGVGQPTRIFSVFISRHSQNVGPLLQNPNPLPVVGFPEIVFTGDRRYSERRRAPSPKPEPDHDADVKEPEAKNRPRVVTYDSPALIFWCLVLAGAGRSMYHTYGWLRRRVTRMCSQAQRLVENIE